MRRREFIGLLARRQRGCSRPARSPTPVIGYLHSGSPSPNAHLVTAFRQGLMEGGYVEGRNIAIEFRWAEGRYDGDGHRAAPLRRL